MTRGRRIAFAALALPLIALFVGLGIWQVERRGWKHRLIARVEAGLAAPPAPAPPPARWPDIGEGDAYARVTAEGRYLAGDTYVLAATQLGRGYWVLTPFADRRGFTLLVNRGFVAEAARGKAPAAPEGDRRIGGLLRVSEPGGGFLRKNDPAADRWYSRDTGAIAARRGLDDAAPYFVDADRHTSPALPRGGLTVIRFRDNHLHYALTWFALAIGLAGASIWVALRRPGD